MPCTSERKTGNAPINVTSRRVRVNTVPVEELLILHILSVSVALVIQNAKRMRRIFLSFVACLDVKYLSTLFHKRNDLWKIKKLLNIKYVF